MTKIVRGNFANGKDRKGNFTAYNSNGDRIFIHKNLMESFGFTKDEDLKKDGRFTPFFANVEEREINPRDEAGNILVDKTVKRLQAVSIALNRDEFISNTNEDAKLEVDRLKDLSDYATSKSLTEDAVNVLLKASI